MKCALFVLLATSLCTAQITVKNGVSVTSMGISITACGLPNFCSPTNTNNDQISAPGALIGVNGINNTFTDVTGNTVIRCTDYANSGGTTGTASYRANSDSNDNVFSSDNTVIGVCRTGGALALIAFDPVGHTCTVKGTSGGLGACDSVSFLHSTTNSYYGTSGANILNLYTINKAASAWASSSGPTQNLSTAITTTQKLDISTQCSGLTFNKYNFLTLPYNLDAADRFVTLAARVAQDQGFQMFVWDSANGCHWIDGRTMTQGGAWGPTGSVTNAGSVLLPSPGAPTLTATTGGSLTTHQYTVCITYTKAEIGETPCSANSQLTLSGGNNAIQVTAPTANPSNTISKASGFNVYACDNTASPGCTPTLVPNGTNASGALLQPTGLALGTCSTNCSGAVNYQVWVYGLNAGGQSPLSAPVTVGPFGVNASFSVTFNQVTNATGYTGLLDFTYNVAINNNNGSCVGGTCTLTINTNSNSIGFSVAQNQVVPIATTPTITTIGTSTQQAPATNTTGVRFHDVKNDGTVWITQIPPGGSSIQSSYSNNTRLFFDWNTGVLLIGNDATSTPALNVGTLGAGHMAVGFGEFMGNDSNTLFPVRWTLNDTSTVAEASKINLANFSVHTTDVHFSPQFKSIDSTYPWWFGADGSGYSSHALPTDAYALYSRAIRDVPLANSTWKFCENWESGLSGFNTQVSGNPSRDGKFILFSSDMGVGTAVTSGQLGNTSGGASCTDNVDCRTDVYICVTR